MAEIIELPKDAAENTAPTDNNKEAMLEELKNSNERLESIFDLLDEEDQSGIKVLAGALGLPDADFAIMAPQLLGNFQKSLNAPEQKLLLVQALNANGLHAEDLSMQFMDLCEQVENEMSAKLSQQKIDFVKQYIGLMINAIEETDGVPKRIIRVPIELINKDAQIPAYAHIGDAGMDVYAVEDIVLNPGETKIIPIGIKCALPAGYELQVRPRSGLSAKSPLRVANAPGTIDSGYRDEIGIIITNTEPKFKDFVINEDGTIDVKSILYGQSYTITKGMKFAQLVLSDVSSCAFFEVDNVMEIGGNRNGGFGSTGY